MKKAVVFLLALAVSVTSVFSQEAETPQKQEAEAPKKNERNWQFLLGLKTGFLIGQAEEIIWRDKHGNDKLSELLWGFKPIFYVGGDIGFTKNTKNRLPGTFFDISFKAAIPGITGKMQDQDWTDDQNKNQLTHYSVSENRTNMAYLFDLKSGCVFNKGIMSIKTFSVISGMFFEWSAYGGSMLYPNIDEHNNIITNAQTHFYISDKTEGIRYRQTWIGIGFGVSLYGEFNRFFNVEVSFAATPLVFFKAKDEHLLRDLVIEDEGDLLNGGTQLDAAFALSVRPANIFAISLEVAYRNIFNSQGRSKYTYHGKDMNIAKNYPITWYSGAGYEAFDISLMFKFII